MTKNTAAARGFLGSLVLLVAALVVFFLVFYPKNDAETQPTLRQPVASDLVSESRRQAMRPAQQRSPLAWEEDEGGATAGRTEGGDKGAEAAVPADLGEEEEDPDVQKAISLVDAGNVTDAITLLESVLKRDPKSEQALVEMAMIQLLDLKQPEQAVNYLQRVMEVNPENLVAMTELVSLYEEQGRIDEGLNFMVGVQASHPASPELAHGVGQMMTLAGRDQEAIAYYEKATQSPEYHVRAHRDLAEAYSRTGDPEKAIDSYTKAIQSQEQEITEKAARGLPVQFAEERLAYTKMDMAREMIRVGDFERAQTILDEISSIMPGDEKITALQDSINKRRAG